MNSANFNTRFQINHMDSSLSKKVVERRRAVARTDSDSTVCEPPLPPPPPPPPPPPRSKCNGCSCSCERARSRLRAGAEEADLQQVEAKLYNAELDEQVGEERLEARRQRMRCAQQLLEAQELFAQSLYLKARALARLTQVTGNFACMEMASSSELDAILDDLRWDVDGLSEQFTAVADAAGAAVATPDQLCQLLDDFKDCKKELKLAANTLNQYVRTSRVNPGQLKKFEVQYDSTRAAYDQSCKLLEKEISKIFDERQAVIERCFSKLVPLQEKMVEQDKQFLALSKEISKSFKEPKKQASKCRQNHSKK